MKRLFDILVSAVLLLMFLPVLFAVSMLVYFRLGSPVFFRQKRPGLDAKPFEIIKFRSMLNAVSQAKEPLPDSLRLTRLGKFLRSTSLDELPELWNVLKGDMSLVGPRPLLVEYLPLYSSRQARRHDVRPGITGWAQVNGRNALSWNEKFELDVWYVDNRSFALDLKILWRTIAAVLARDGISNDGHVTMPPFRGNVEI
jgi:lipopolysaccharide/colanic/teichoic acid biosynthesis glycosyltransferase